MSRLLEPRHALAVAALPIALSLAACGGSSGKASQASTSRSSATPPQSQQATGGAANGASSRNAQGQPSQTGGTAARGATGSRNAQRRTSPQTGANRSAARNGAATTAQSSASLARRRAALQHVISVYAACLRQHGVKLPASSNGSLSTKGVNTASPRYRHASVACRAVAVAALRAEARQLRSAKR